MKPIIAITILFFCSLAFAKSNNNLITLNVNQNAVDTISKTKKVEIINQSFDNLVTKFIGFIDNQNSTIGTILTVLSGALITLITQLLIEFLKTFKEKKNKKRELFSKGIANTFLIFEVIKELVMYKVHKQYYWRAYEINKLVDNFNKHYEKGQEQRKTEAKLNSMIAEHYQVVTEFAILTNQISLFEAPLDQLLHYVHPKSDNFKDVNFENLITQLNDEEKKLNEKYKTLTDIFEKIQTLMRKKSH